MSRNSDRRERYLPISNGPFELAAPFDPTAGPLRRQTDSEAPSPRDQFDAAVERIHADPSSRPEVVWKLVQEIAPDLVRSRLRRGRVCDDVEDIVSAVALKVLESRSPIQSGRHLRCLLSKVVREHIIDLWRKRGHRGRVVTESECDQLRGVNAPLEVGPADSSPGPLGSAAQREVLGAMRDCVDRLPPRERQAIELRYFEGWTFATIGAALHCSGQYAKRLHDMGLAQLRQMMSRHEGDGLRSLSG